MKDTHVGGCRRDWVGGGGDETQKVRIMVVEQSQPL